MSQNPIRLPTGALFLLSALTSPTPVSSTIAPNPPTLLDLLLFTPAFPFPVVGPPSPGPSIVADLGGPLNAGLEGRGVLLGVVVVLLAWLGSNGPETEDEGESGRAAPPRATV